uniref:Uncharacterized protein n=1 Tax=Melopsittacus undulatus TaxID=13146 RepID=A0A8C6JIV2_MELUD
MGFDFLLRENSPNADNHSTAMDATKCIIEIVSGNRLDTTQMATTSHTFVVVPDADAPPSADRSPAPDEPTPATARTASAPSTSDTLSVAVAERAGSPWSRTTMTRRCRGPSASSNARAVLTSPDPRAEASLCLSLQFATRVSGRLRSPGRP